MNMPKVGTVIASKKRSQLDDLSIKSMSQAIHYAQQRIMSTPKILV
jgi:hypothetical protein